jgi:hypothetical protein
MDSEKTVTSNFNANSQQNKRSHTTAGNPNMSVKSGSATSQAKMENLKTSGSQNSN